MFPSNFLEMKSKQKLLTFKLVILSDILCFYPRSMRTSGVIVFLQIVFCFQSVSIDTTKTAIDLASRGKITSQVLILWYFFLSSPSLYCLSLLLPGGNLYLELCSERHKELDDILCWQESCSYFVLVESCGGGCFVRFTENFLNIYMILCEEKWVQSQSIYKFCKLRQLTYNFGASISHL